MEGSDRGEWDRKENYKTEVIGVLDWNGGGEMSHNEHYGDGTKDNQHIHRHTNLSCSFFCCRDCYSGAFQCESWL
jgi:hypothetical protein